MKHYTYTKTLCELWECAVENYRKKIAKEQWFGQEELDFLASIGMNLQELFDFAEDYASGGEPDLGTVIAVQDVRRSYFLEKQGGKPTGKEIDMSKLPPKNEAVEGIEWLPRLIQKAYAKLHGEMPADLMYGCGGDRRFFSTHDIHPAEFLRYVAEHEGDTRAIINWVKSRSVAQ